MREQRGVEVVPERARDNRSGKQTCAVAAGFWCSTTNLGFLKHWTYSEHAPADTVWLASMKVVVCTSHFTTNAKYWFQLYRPDYLLTVLFAGGHNGNISVILATLQQITRTVKMLALHIVWDFPRILCSNDILLYQWGWYNSTTLNILTGINYFILPVVKLSKLHQNLAWYPL